MDVNVNGSWKGSSPYANVSGVWEPVHEVHVNSGGSWLQVFDDAAYIEINTNLGGLQASVDIGGGERAANCLIEWGDGSSNSYSGVYLGSVYHTYAAHGTYTIRITGLVEHFGDTPRDNWQRVLSFGELGTVYLRDCFNDGKNLIECPPNLPRRSQVTDLESCFDDCTIFNHPNVTKWDLSGVTSLQRMFRDARAFNQDISGWDTSTVTDMGEIFHDAFAFNQDISGWNVSNVVYMQFMFDSAYAFNQDISGWDTSSVLYMAYMFRNSTAFNQDLSSWCVSNIPTAPASFDTGATAWTLPRPVWGTCP